LITETERLRTPRETNYRTAPCNFAIYMRLEWNRSALWEKRYNKGTEIQYRTVGRNKGRQMPTFYSGKPEQRSEYQGEEMLIWRIILQWILKGIWV
jgi:hypothetical protein